MLQGPILFILYSGGPPPYRTSGTVHSEQQCINLEEVLVHKASKVMMYYKRGRKAGQLSVVFLCCLCFQINSLTTARESLH